MAIDRDILNEDAEYKKLKFVIEEELGISEEVMLLANKSARKIVDEYKPGYTLKVTPFSEKCGEYTILFDMRDFDKLSEAQKEGAEYKGVTYFTKKEIVVFGFTVRGKLLLPNLYEVLQHELKHVFDLYKANKEGFFNTYDEYGIYATAADHARSKTVPYELKTIGYAIYLSHDFESRAFESGTYGYLMNQDLHFIGDEVKAVKETMYYKRLMYVRYAYDFIMKNEKEAEDIARTYYGKSYKWLKKKVTVALKQTRRQIGRAVAKVRKDYDWTHGGGSTVWA